jgi:hypothetical protein
MLIQRGSVTLEPHGQNDRPIAELSSGSFVGEDSFVSSEPEMFTGIQLVRKTTVLVPAALWGELCRAMLLLLFKAKCCAFNPKHSQGKGSSSRVFLAP